MTTREELHKLVDQLADADLENARHDLLGRLAKHDPLLQELLEAPEDNEPVSLEEEEGARVAREEYRRGEYVSAEEAKRELLP